MIRTLIIDDEPLARQELMALLAEHQDIEVVAQAANAIDGLSKLHQFKPDLVLVDIQMPKITGMEMISMLDNNELPHIVFVTAYDQYAIKAFEHHATDYLLKPIEAQRLAQTLARIRTATTPAMTTQLEPLPHLPCYSHKRLKIVDVSEVEYVFSDVSGVHVATSEGTYHTQLTLKVIEQQPTFIRCHRQYLVQADAVAEIILLDGGNAEIETRSNQKVPVSRRYLKPLKQKFGFQ
ncbi:two-component system response regulator BtsR [Ferrimonas lipolytica]|uniref:Two-component system response regulator BtsR n=1 Tax=Ferrimonas lipolytica TaxID=2724191 RepID=A0A6H1UD26_9GAMM|nr:two-component system response regulator BtsR [Ferrimonas lipolytica]QIZ77007.1 two-component system response regulator BtsR [Ferrimonas lipolytica]